MTSTRPSLSRNVLRSFAGQVAPGLAAIAAMPFLLRGLGADGLGILHLTWAVIGYFSLLDVGIGRAVTQAVAAALARKDAAGVAGIAFTGCAALTLLGTLGGLVLWMSAGWAASSLFTVAGSLQAAAASAFRLVAVCLPLITLTSGARGILEAQQRFDLVNRVRVPVGILIYAGPAAALPWSRSIVVAVAIAVAVRALGAAAYVYLVWRHTPAAGGRWTWSREAARTLASSGGWMAAANLTGTVTQFADRLVVAARVSVSAVAYYSTPLEVISRVSIVSVSLVTVMFPAFSAEHAVRGPRLATLAVKSAAYTLLVLAPPTLGLVILAPELLAWWLGPAFADASLLATRLIAVGTLANALAQTPFALLQATGRARATARLAALELPVYLAGLWFSASAWGVNGVALAWMLRMVGDAVLHFAVAGDTFRHGGRDARAFAWSCAAVAAALALAVPRTAGAVRLVAAVVAAALAAAAFTCLLDWRELGERVRSLAATSR